MIVTGIRSDETNSGISSSEESIFYIESIERMRDARNSTVELQL